LPLAKRERGMVTITDHSMEAATARNKAYDLKLRIIGGGGTDGALNITDLEALVRFVQGAASQDPSLTNLSLVEVRKGSRVAVLRALPHHGLPNLFSPIHAIAEIFERGTREKKAPLELPYGVLEAFRTWTRGGAKVEVAFRGEKTLRIRKVTFDQQSLAMAKPKRAKALTEKNFTGRLVRLHSDEDVFGVETNQGVIHCPFPEHEKESWIALYERLVSIRVKAPQRPISGPWRASETLKIEVLPDPPAFEFDENIPGLIPPRVARPGGFCMEDLFPGLEPEDVDSLTDFLAKYRES